MIKKYNQYIKEQSDYIELDPYGEEDWYDLILKKFKIKLYI